MSARAELWVEEHYRSSTRRGASQRKFVLYVLARSANEHGETVRDTVLTIARKADQDVRTVQRHLRQLAAEGVLECVKQGNGTGSAPNLYRIPAVASMTTRVRSNSAALGCIHSSPPCETCARKTA